MHHPVINYKYLIYFIDLFLVYMYSQSIDEISFNYKFSFQKLLKFTTLERILHNFHFVIILKTIQLGSWSLFKHRQCSSLISIVNNQEFNNNAK